MASDSLHTLLTHIPKAGRDNKALRAFVICLFAISSYIVVRYSKIPWFCISWIVLFAVSLFAFARLSLDSLVKRTKLLISIFVFAIFFDFALILGHHIVIGDAGTYSGLLTDNYISPYHLYDVICFFFMLPCLLSLFLYPVSRCCERVCSDAHGGRLAWIGSFSLAKLDCKWVLFFALIVIVGWIPYIVVYWPGLIFGDSLSSVSQVLGESPLSNHHPVAYTMFLGFWIGVSNSFGFSIGLGIGLSTICQSLLLALSFGYLSRWIVVRCRLSNKIGLVCSLFFSVSPYVATYGVALWKDPLFSAGLTIFSLCVVDFVLSKGTLAKEKRHLLPLTVASLLVVVFFRNNGIYISLVTVVVIVVLCLVWRRREGKPVCWSFAGAVAGISVVYLVVSSIVFPVMGVQASEKVESVGVPLNQMARVAALNGEMSESDIEFMNSMLPLDDYASVYTPCCTDNLKWAPNFNADSLDNGMWEHWLSMLLKNPRVFFEAWELQTFGFWTVNTEEQAGWSWNITGGVPRNSNVEYVAQLEGYGIETNPIALNPYWTETLLPLDDWSVPIGWLSWGIVYLMIMLFAAKRQEWAIALVPSLALVATLIIASPICYWPRYGAAVQFMIPFYLAMVYILFRDARKGV